MQLIYKYGDLQEASGFTYVSEIKHAIVIKKKVNKKTLQIFAILQIWVQNLITVTGGKGICS